MMVDDGSNPIFLRINCTSTTAEYNVDLNIKIAKSTKHLIFTAIFLLFNFEKL